MYLTGVSAAMLWWHLSGMDVISRIYQQIFHNENITNGEINERGFSILTH